MVVTFKKMMFAAIPLAITLLLVAGVSEGILRSVFGNQSFVVKTNMISTRSIK